MKKRKGQALLIILLVTVVGVTLGLSLATRSVSDIKVSTRLEESSRAFSAAEAGIEAALKGEAAPVSTPIPIGNSSYTFTTAPAGGSASLLRLNTIYMADTFTVWLTGHDSSGNIQLGPTFDYGGTTIDVCWQKVAGAPAGDPTPAMEISVFYNDGTSIKVQRGAYDPGSHVNGFTQISGAPGSCAGFLYGQTITFPGLGGSGYLIAMRLRPFYADADMAVVPQSGFSLSSQGLVINSTGTSGQTVRKVNVLESYPALPAVFDYALFSGTCVNSTGSGCP